MKYKKEKILLNVCSLLLVNNYVFAKCDCSEDVTQRYNIAINKIDPEIEKLEKSLKEYYKKLERNYDLKVKDNKLYEQKLSNDLKRIVKLDDNVNSMNQLNKKLELQKQKLFIKINTKIRKN